MEQNLAIGICVVLGLLLVLKEVFRSDKGRVFWRITASIVVVTAFYFLLFPFQYKVKNTSQTDEMIFLSPGADLDSIPSGATAFTDDESLYKQHKRLKYIPDLRYFLKVNPNYTRIKLYGFGLDNDQLKQLKEYPIEFHPRVNEGFTDSHWSQKLKSTEQFRVQGTYRHSGPKALKLFLNGLGSKQDSVMLSPGASTRFSLQAQPQLIGKAVYHLHVLNGKDTVAVEPLPFMVEEAPAMRVVMLSSYPDFEFKFLKNWLYENKYPLIFRTQISKDKFSTDYLNTESMGIARMNASLLNSVDVLILDEETLQGLSMQERSAVNQATQSGMGMLLLAKTPKAVQLRGEGKVAVSNAQETFRLALAGKTAEYAKYWSDQLKEIARKKAADLSWIMKPQIPVSGSRSSLLIDAPQQAGIPEIKVNAKRYPVLQNMELLFQWQVMLWPERSGWNTLAVNDHEDSFYVFKPGDWESLKNQELLRSTTGSIAKLKKPATAAPLDREDPKSLSLWWPFMLFLMGAAYLWYEQRFLCNKIN